VLAALRARRTQAGAPLASGKHLPTPRTCFSTGSKAFLFVHVFFVLLSSVSFKQVQGLLRVCLEHAVGLSDHKEPPALAAVLAAFPPQAAELAQLALQHIAEPSEDLVKVITIMV
jgi:hypothetical protein